MLGVAWTGSKFVAVGVGGTILTADTGTPATPPTEPTIAVTPSSRVVSTGGPVTISATSSGTSPLSYQWDKDGTPIAGATNSTLVLSNLQTSAAGNYSITVSNSAGQVSQIGAIIGLENNTLLLNLPVTSGLPLTYQWSKDRVPIQGATNALLVISSLRAADAGTYSIAVSNAATSVTRQVDVIVLRAAAVIAMPTITEQPANQTVAAGFLAQFSVTASPFLGTTYQWYKNGAAIPGATSFLYTINNATSADAGSYTVVVSNAGGSVTSNPATLTVNGAGGLAPTISAHPADQTTAVGFLTFLGVTASGAQPLSYQWYKNGVAVAGATSMFLTIGSSQPSDAGTYTVVVSNSSGSVTSSAAVVRVGDAPNFLVQPQAQSAVVGSSVSLMVTVAGTAPFTYQWKHNGTLIPGATNSTLLLANVQPADAGSYEVTVANSGGSATSNAVQLTVNSPAPPAVSQSPSAGGSATFTSTAGSGAVLQWQKNGTAISGATNSTLTLGNIQPADAGIYTAAVTTNGNTTINQIAVLGLNSTAKLLGPGTEFPNIFHAGTGFTYDQVLPASAATSITCDSDLGKIVRASFIDLNDDIVQVEMSGPGTLTLVLDNSSGPAPARKYNQPAISYMKGHAGIVLTGATRNTHLTIFSVGRAIPGTNPALYYDGVTYDGFADLAFVAIVSTDGEFGGVRAANANFFAAKGYTGLYAPGVKINGPVFVSDINAADNATPVFMIGSDSDVRITGGDLLQANGRAVQVSGFSRLQFTAGTSSQGALFPAQANRGRLEQNGTDVTSQIVVNPVP